MSADPPSFVADVAAQVVAWHNRHPLARRITRRDVQSVGIVELPFAREGQPPWHASPPKRGLLALMFPKRVDRRPWALFSEDPLPEIGPKKLAAFALRHGFVERPGPPELPERVLESDRDLLDAPRGDLPPERLNRYLVTAAIDIGPARPRVVMGHGRRMPVLGQRLWSVPRLAALGGAAMVSLLVGAAALWLVATQRAAQSPVAARAASMPAAGAASTTRIVGPASAVAPAPAPSVPREAAAVAAAAAAAASLPGSAAAAASAGVVAPVAPPVSPPVASPVAPPAFPPVSPAVSPPVSPPVVPPVVPPVAAPSAPPPARAASVAAPLAASTPAIAPPPAPASAPARAPIAASEPAPTPMAASAVAPDVQRASAPLVPRLKPDLAEAARAEREKHPNLPRPAAGASAPRAAAAPSGPVRFYALVSRPIRQRAEAEGVLKRLRAETSRIAHPTAIETGLQQTADGWRVTWWPFTHPRQAENARAALAARGVPLEMVEF